MMSTIFFVCT